MKNVKIIKTVLNMKDKKREDLISKCRIHKYINVNINKIEKMNWDDKIKDNMKFFYPPRFLIVEVI